MELEYCMDKDKKEKKQQEMDNQKSAAHGNKNETDESQTMVALTFDEYEVLEKEIESLQVELESQKDGWLRTRADFDNYKKRVQRDAARSHQDTLAGILKIFLVVVDDIERALKNKPEDKAVEGWVNGIELIHQKLLTQINNQGVEQLATAPGDEFDPNLHEAITQEEHPNFKDGQIIEVIQPGYRISDRIIRPAMVRVAR